MSTASSDTTADVSGADDVQVFLHVRRVVECVDDSDNDVMMIAILMKVKMSSTWINMVASLIGGTCMISTCIFPLHVILPSFFLYLSSTLAFKCIFSLPYCIFPLFCPSCI